MRNLKKTLCLVLALVFVLGLCTVGVGAANGTTFSDEKEIQYDTAVKAMSGLGILIGNDDDGDGVAEFSPTGTLTRAAAAKMIAYMVLGLDADKYPKIEVFSDVTPSDPSTWWAAPYIAFCYSQGIIAGMGDGTFRPSAPVTQAQFAKMLLAACGYNGKKEFEGAGWDQNVAKVAMQTKILKNLNNVNWDGEATREEAALLTFNTMTEVAQVVLSKDTDDYKAKEVNGGNFGNATWKLKSVEGYVVTNMSNNSTAKGIVLNNSGTGTGSAYVPAYFQAEDDAADANMLGHYVKITYRYETIKGEEVAVVYFVEDNCKEVSGAAVLTAQTLGTGADGNPRTFINGKIETTKQVDATPPATGKITVAAYDAPTAFSTNTYVVNADGKIVAYKIETYFLANITAITAGNAKFMDGTTEVTVKAPEGAKVGDTYTVFKRGNTAAKTAVYTLEPCTVQKGVKIEQSKKASGYWTYNDGKINGSAATNIDDDTYQVPNAGMTRANPNNATADLNLGSTYTLYFDSKGDLYAYSDEVSAASASYSYVYVLKTYQKADEFGTTKDYAQVIKADGTIENALPFTPSGTATDGTPQTNYQYTSNTALWGTTVSGVTYPAQYPEVFKYSYNNTTYQYEFTTAASTAGETIEIATTKLSNDGDPTVDFSGATFICWNKYAGAYAGASTNAVPNKNADIRYIYTLGKEGTTPVRKVKAVWFFDKLAKAEADSYIYVTSADASKINFTKRIGNDDVNFFNGYKDGTKMDDLAFNPLVVHPGTESIRCGFANYVKDSSGYYSLTYVSNPGGTPVDANIIERNVYLSGQDATAYILKGSLYIAGDNNPIDLSKAKVVRIASMFTDTDYVAWMGDQTKSLLTLNSIAAIESALQLGYGIRITFVEHVNGDVHSIGTDMIYVIAVK